MISGVVRAMLPVRERAVMTDQIKLPRALSEEPNAPKPRRPSHQKIIENLDRWANSSELQPPKRPDSEIA